MKLKLHVSIIFITGILFQGCLGFVEDCGLFGSADIYHGSLRIDKPFQDLNLMVGDSLDFYPDENLEIEYTYSGNCGGSDYETDPYEIILTVRIDSLVSVTERTLSGAQRHFVIEGIHPGSTVLDLEAIWTFEGRDYFGSESDTFHIPITIAP